MYSPNSQVFSPKTLFDVDSFEYKNLFDDLEFAWEAISSLNQFLREFFKNNSGNFAKNVFVGKNVAIDKTVRIIGPAIICDDATISFNSYLRENVVIGPGCIIGHAVELKNTVVMGKSNISHYNYIGDSIIGSGVNFGAGAKTANFRLDGKSVSVKDLSGNVISTDLEKFGALVGDNTKIGANSILNPGTVLGKECVVYPLVSVVGTHKPLSRVK